MHSWKSCKKKDLDLDTQVLSTSEEGKMDASSG